MSWFPRSETTERRAAVAPLDGWLGLVACEGATHQMRWSWEGGLELLDHDEEADAVLLALGGAAPVCHGVRRSWEQGRLFQRSAWAMEVAGLVALPEPLRRVRALLTRRSLEAVLRDEGARALRRASGGRVRIRDVSVRVGEPASLRGAQLVLPTSWLTEVWLLQRELAAGSLRLTSDV